MGVDAKMFVRTKQPLQDREVARLAGEMCARFGIDNFIIDRTGSYGKPSHALEIIGQYDQDGPDILPEPGEQFIEVNLRSRYYGPGYERGDWPLIRTVAEFLEIKIPGGGEVWYGGDSSGVCAQLFNEDVRDLINEHFLSVGHEPYRSYFGSYSRRDQPPVCDFCGGKPFHESGGGGGKTFYSCDGCGEKRIRKDGQDHTLLPTEDFFTWGRIESTTDKPN